MALGRGWQAEDLGSVPIRGSSWIQAEGAALGILFPSILEHCSTPPEPSSSNSAGCKSLSMASGGFEEIQIFPPFCSQGCCFPSEFALCAPTSPRSNTGKHCDTSERWKQENSFCHLDRSPGSNKSVPCSCHYSSPLLINLHLGNNGI